MSPRWFVGFSLHYPTPTATSKLSWSPTHHSSTSQLLEELPKEYNGNSSSSQPNLLPA